MTTALGRPSIIRSRPRWRPSRLRFGSRDGSRSSAGSCGQALGDCTTVALAMGPFDALHPVRPVSADEVLELIGRANIDQLSLLSDRAGSYRCERGRRFA
jgi:hypothetical protein